MKTTFVLHTFNTSIWEEEAGRSEFEAFLVYKVSYRTATTITQRNLVFKKPN